MMEWEVLEKPAKRGRVESAGSPERTRERKRSKVAQCQLVMTLVEMVEQLSLNSAPMETEGKESW